MIDLDGPTSGTNQQVDLATLGYLLQVYRDQILDPRTYIAPEET